MARIVVSGRLRELDVRAEWTDDAGVSGDDELLAAAEALVRARIDVALPGYAGGDATLDRRAPADVVAATLMRPLEDAELVEAELELEDPPDGAVL